MKLNYITFILINILSISLFANSNTNSSIFQINEETELEAFFDDHADFNKSVDEFTVVEFTLSRVLNSNEEKEMNELNSENAERIKIEVNGLQVKISLKSDISNSNVWAKIFHTIGISQYTFGDKTDQIKQPFDVFANHFKLK
ncbi:hypothetical protein K6119_08490 [Paracrocinitomix mangrovi]|uniref:hypothetical protein n=1 Tax=Paracrocinitomix mangrovi TaxID=2862509 RepID=UPI001C8D28EA|nr:hypothetical protein [Paracrocinitomix mangrovi]UKN03551.1 hypothetical protein K6119_08490 [Paracrocinitomix mangrovi]